MDPAGDLDGARPPPHVEMTDIGVRVHHRGVERVDEVLWDDLVSISVYVELLSPYVDDVFWLLEDTSGGCYVPQQAMPDERVQQLAALPGFDHAALSV